ncbi:hypothetical protein T439DRAFT_248577 [Meredithblackwellia eburnea MCA 4105]
MGRTKLKSRKSVSEGTPSFTAINPDALRFGRKRSASHHPSAIADFHVWGSHLVSPKGSKRDTPLTTQASFLLPPPSTLPRKKTLKGSRSGILSAAGARFRTLLDSGSDETMPALLTPPPVFHVSMPAGPGSPQTDDWAVDCLLSPIQLVSPPAKRSRVGAGKKKNASFDSLGSAHHRSLKQEPEGEGSGVGVSRLNNSRLTK